MTCGFTSFQQYFSHIRTMGGLKLNGMCNGTSFTAEKISPRTGLELGTRDFSVTWQLGYCQSLSFLLSTKHACWGDTSFAMDLVRLRI